MHAYVLPCNTLLSAHTNRTINNVDKMREEQSTSSLNANLMSWKERFDLIEIFKEAHEWIAAVNAFVIATAEPTVNKLLMFIESYCTVLCYFCVVPAHRRANNPLTQSKYWKFVAVCGLGRNGKTISPFQHKKDHSWQREHNATEVDGMECVPCTMQMMCNINQ